MNFLSFEVIVVLCALTRLKLKVQISHLFTLSDGHWVLLAAVCLLPSVPSNVVNANFDKSLVLSIIIHLKFKQIWEIIGV